MSITFDITMRGDKQAQGRLRWPEKNLDSPAISGPHRNGYLPDGLYLAKANGFSDREGQAPFCDKRNSCWFQYVEPQFSTSRTQLGVHPDGNVVGTEGCIGLMDADCGPWRRAFESISADVPLEVKQDQRMRFISDSLAISRDASARSGWPADSQAALEAFYSKHVLGNTGKPTAAWERDHLTTLQLPYRMTLSWDLSATIRRITCHKKVAESLDRILNGVLAHYGTEAEVKRNRMHLFGGCYLYRPVAGGARLSTHSWGAAIDLDPERNPLSKPWDSNSGMMPLEVVAIFEAEGWRWGGRFSSRPDCMHFQATA